MCGIFLVLGAHGFGISVYVPSNYETSREMEACLFLLLPLARQGSLLELDGGDVDVILVILPI